MRVDVFLKLTGIFKTRSAAGRAASAGYVSIGGRKLKSSHNVSPGQVIDIVRPDGRSLSIEVSAIPEDRQVPRKERDKYFSIREEHDRW